MPLSEKARIEVYIPDLPLVAYYRLLETLEAEFTYNFGGCTLQRGLDGNYLSGSGEPVQDRVTLLYTDTPYSFSDNRTLLSDFVDALRDSAAMALDEEAILVAILPLYHAEQ
ncbi:MAG: hypothetical protein ACRYFS_24370 [Janthinobacterium lividum]